MTRNLGAFGRDLAQVVVPTAESAQFRNSSDPDVQHRVQHRRDQHLAAGVCFREVGLVQQFARGLDLDRPSQRVCPDLADRAPELLGQAE